MFDNEDSDFVDHRIGLTVYGQVTAQYEVYEMKKALQETECVQFTYERSSGDLELMARNVDEAAHALRQFGINVDMKRLKQTGSRKDPAGLAPKCPTCGRTT